MYQPYLPSPEGRPTIPQSPGLPFLFSGSPWGRMGASKGRDWHALASARTVTGADLCRGRAGGSDRKRHSINGVPEGARTRVLAAVKVSNPE